MIGLGEGDAFVFGHFPLINEWRIPNNYRYFPWIGLCAGYTFRASDKQK